MTVKVYTTKSCPYCVRAKALLSQNKIPFEEIDLTTDQARREAVAKETGWTTVPMIFFGEKFIGGYDDLQALESRGELKKLSQS